MLKPLKFVMFSLTDWRFSPKTTIKVYVSPNKKLSKYENKLIHIGSETMSHNIHGISNSFITFFFLN